ncbi:ImmA/IrrE family metallo-endopeptidase [Jonesiaceae bacterium BS-20]|uniref:ImmA/IrrE family metallo-endopeptidase n=1 Tax=Jonesiaceae bacterium BS-20 TaxID=3120821 RepID=A0AAU7DX99_9MICO
MINSLVDHAATMGHRVEFLPLHGKSGLLLPNRLILINSERRAMTQKVALAHELGHVHYGHDWRYRHDRERDEAQADKYAASLLISPVEYAVAEAMYDSPPAIAHELEVPVKLLLLWQSLYSVGSQGLVRSA